MKSLDESGIEFVVRAVGPLCELGLQEGETVIFRPERINLIPVDPEDKDSALYLVPESFVVGVK